MNLSLYLPSYLLSCLLGACQIGQAQKKLKSLRPSGKELARPSSQEVRFNHI